MKYSIALLALIAFISVNGQTPLNLTEEQKLKVLQHAAACMEQEKSTAEAAQALIKGQFDGLDKNAKCFGNCFLERTGFLVNGVVQPSVILAKLGPSVGEDKVNAIMTKCNGLKGSDKCETAFVLYECYYKQNAVIF